MSSHEVEILFYKWNYDWFWVACFKHMPVYGLHFDSLKNVIESNHWPIVLLCSPAMKEGRFSAFNPSALPLPSDTCEHLECILPFFPPHTGFPLLLFIFSGKKKIGMFYTFLCLVCCFSFLKILPGNSSKTNYYSSLSFFLIAEYYSLQTSQHYLTILLWIVL